MIDLRSDTITKPCDKMLKAMINATVGDDVYGEDPTVLELEQTIAKYFGMEKAMFFPSGTMANQTAIKLHTNPGDQVITHKYSMYIIMKVAGRHLTVVFHLNFLTEKKVFLIQIK